MSGVPSACRKVLSGSRAAGWLAAAVAARRWSLYVTACELVTCLAMSVSWSCHIWRKSLPGLASINQRFHTAPHVHCAALKLSSGRSLFNVICAEKVGQLLKGGSSMHAPLFNRSVKVQWPSDWHQGVFQQSVTILFND